MRVTRLYATLITTPETTSEGAWSVWLSCGRCDHTFKVRPNLSDRAPLLDGGLGGDRWPPREFPLPVGGWRTNYGLLARRVRDTSFCCGIRSYRLETGRSEGG